MSATAAEFFGLEETEEPGRWRLPVVPRICSGLGAVFGGAGLGAGVEVLEQMTGRPVVWATAQFLSYASPPAVLEVRAEEVVRGLRTSQARAILRTDEEEILTVNAALGSKPGGAEGVFESPPAVPPPDDCPPRDLLPHQEGTIADHVDVRLAAARGVDELPGPRGGGTCALWARIPGIDTSKSASAATLAIVGDYVPFGISQALGARTRGNSLDNTIRMVNCKATEWILADVRIHAVVGGFGCGLVHLWAQDGTLLATASQSAIVRPWRKDRAGPGRLRR